jgi:hypothetical protein
LLSLTIFLPSPALAAGPAAVAVVASPQSVGPGQQFTVSLNVQPNNAIAGMQLNLSFDPSLVTVTGVVEGNLLSQGGLTTYFMPGQTNNSAGTVSNIAGVITGAGQTVSTAGTFAAIAMTAKSAAGTSPIRISGAVVGNANGQPISVTVSDSQVTIAGSQSAPPSTQPPPPSGGGSSGGGFGGGGTAGAAAAPPPDLTHLSFLTYK